MVSGVCSFVPYGSAIFCYSLTNIVFAYLAILFLMAKN